MINMLLQMLMRPPTPPLPPLQSMTTIDAMRLRSRFFLSRWPNPTVFVKLTSEMGDEVELP